MAQAPAEALGTPRNTTQYHDFQKIPTGTEKSGTTVALHWKHSSNLKANKLDEMG
jgi:hypothetical protein